MPLLQRAVVKEIPAALRGQTFPPPTSASLRPTCDASEIPALAAEGITGPVRIFNISSAGTRNHPDGRPMLWLVEFACVNADGSLPEVRP